MRSFQALPVAFALGAAMSTGSNWDFSPTPEDGLTDVTFSFNVANAPHQAGYYFAQQYSFKGAQDGGYTGVQPRADDNGQSVLHGVFSSFQAGATTDHPNCHDGADNGPGVSCANDVPLDYSHTYNTVVENIGGTTWRGTLVDTDTGEEYVIGEYTMPEGTGNIKGSEVGFIEYYLWNDGTANHECTTLPYTEITFGVPTTTTSGAGDNGRGELSNFHEYGECVGQSNYETETLADGSVHVKVGYKAAVTATTRPESWSQKAVQLMMKII
ncbi:uncharacterized protein E0L32_003141 [Thyridium curvatum]|uniref:Uncharacterized protein n=1 Tax=Thyridium curvatum TaxID=1093900 RepID=A0A507BLE7_9PEZI|nr:uncharacterized protein E0L32_003141 [Thyridium curvatum]TPX17498.1 hypothetical protein E0L32_003141 [Thyridium curvatum]